MNFFPPDVKLRINGNKEAGEALIGEARNMFVKATLMQNDRPHAPVQLIRYLEGGGSILVFLIDSQKIITITAPYVPPELEDTDEPALDVAAGIYVLCGMVRNQDNVVVDGVTYLKDFRPTLPTSRAHKIPNSYSNNERLANLLYPPHAGLYSGAMKRVVAAVEGLGKIKDASGYYLTSTPVTRVVVNQYQYSWSTTHGIYKAGPKNHWLLEVSAQNGLLAMPLPLINSTRGAGYLKRLVRLGDTGGATIVREFGGLPSGETFPTGTDLTDAITAGRVLRLLTASEMSGFYGATSGEVHSFPFSWAFSESGTRVVNNRFVFNQLAGDPLKYELRGQMWQINIQLSMHSTAIPRPDPVGTGTATLSLAINGKRLSKTAAKRFIGTESGELSTPILQNFISSTVMVDKDDTLFYEADIGREQTDWGSPLYAFFDGERLIRVRWCPAYLWMLWLNVGLETVTPLVAESIDFNRGPFYAARQDSGYWYSSAGFVMDYIDLREIDGVEVSTWGDPVYYPYQLFLDTYGAVGAQHVYGIRRDSGLPFGGTWPYEFYGLPYPYAFIAQPTDFPTEDSFAYSRVNMQFYVENAVANPETSPAVQEAKLASSNYGSGGITGRAKSTTYLTCILPGQCREGAVVAKVWNHEDSTGPTTRSAKGYFTGLGVMDVPVYKAFQAPDVTTAPIYFAMKVNPGPTVSYIMTKEIGTAYQGYGLPYKHPGYTMYGALPGTDTGFSVTTSNTSYIGSY